MSTGWISKVSIVRVSRRRHHETFSAEGMKETLYRRDITVEAGSRRATREFREKSVGSEAGFEVDESTIQSFKKDGVVLLRDALDAAELEAALSAWQGSINHPGPAATGLVPLSLIHI